MTSREYYDIIYRIWQKSNMELNRGQVGDIHIYIHHFNIIIMNVLNN